VFKNKLFQTNIFHHKVNQGMKQTVFLLLLTSAVFKLSAQAPPIDSLTKLLATRGNDTVKVDAYGMLSFYDQSFQHGLDLAQKGLALARKIKYGKGEGDCLFQMGNQYSLISNSPMALYYYLEALKIWERINYRPGMASGYVAIGVIYKEQGDYKNAINYLRKAERAKPVNVDPAALAYGSALLYSHFGDVYALLNQQDSALKYFLQSYEYFNSAHEEYQLNLALNGLGAVQFKMGNTELALGYYRQAIRNGIAYNDTLGLSATYLGMAELYSAGGEKDSGIFYGEKAMFNAQRGNVLKNVIAAGKLLSKLYQDKDDKQALHYLQVSQDANDSLYGRQKTMELQNMFMNEAQREKELAEKVQREAEQRKQNIEYALIAVGIVTFIIVFLLLSRSIIVTERWISFFGVLGLLVVFEFLNLVIHPSLASITHESPVLMLAALVIVASLLIPLHHRLEKWIKEKMTEKNKKIRLANAKKTIEQLEKKAVSAEKGNSNEQL
jgi:tetratricopeptide (TPR) repeat protein